MMFFKFIINLLSVSNHSVPLVSCYYFQENPKVSKNIDGRVSLVSKYFLLEQASVLLKDIQ